MEDAVGYMNVTIHSNYELQDIKSKHAFIQQICIAHVLTAEGPQIIQ